MIYIKLEDLSFPHHQGDIRIEHPEIGDEFVCPPTFAPVEKSAEPVVDRMTSKLEFGTPRKDGEQWRVDYVVVPLSEQEIANINKKPSEVETDPVLKAIKEKIEKEMA